MKLFNSIAKQFRKTLIIAEKPSMAIKIAQALDCPDLSTDKGYLSKNSGLMITWTFGHLYEQLPPDSYLPDDVPLNKNGNKIWRKQDLPIIPQEWKLREKKSPKGINLANQIRLIRKLTEQQNCIVHAGDPDREGQLLVDQLLDKIGNNKKVLRMWLPDLSRDKVIQAYNDLKPNDNYANLKDAAIARSRADWLLGMNLTRACTIDAQFTSVGRVQTPTLNMIAQRDFANRDFVAKEQYNLKAKIEIDGKIYTANCIDKELIDTQDKGQMRVALNEANNNGRQDNSIGSNSIQFSNEDIDMNPPSVFDTASLQAHMQGLTSNSLSEIQSAAQSLYMDGGCSYVRTDSTACGTGNSATSLAYATALARNSGIDITGFSGNNISNSFSINTEIQSAHSGITPVMGGYVDKPESNNLKDVMYREIRTRYLMQFMEQKVVNEKKYIINYHGRSFEIKARAIKNKGWSELDKEHVYENEEIPENISQMEVKEFFVETTQTTPPEAYTESGLVMAMKKIKNKDGFYTPLGTPATRDKIIANLISRQYVNLTKDNRLKITNTGIQVLKNSPEEVKNPYLTAAWEDKITNIESGHLGLDQFLEETSQWVGDQTRVYL